MRFVFMLLHRVVLVAVAAAVCVWLMRRMAPASAIGLWAGVMAGMCGLSIMLLRTAPIGKITWKNRVAGSFLPFGYTMGRGKLWPIALTSWVVWVLVAVAVAILLKHPQPVQTTAETPGPPSSMWRTLLFIAWAVDAGGVVYLFGVMSRFTPGSKNGVHVVSIIAILLAMIAGSAGLHYAGHPRTALLVAGGPPAVLAALFGLFMLIILTVGRNARWN